MSTDHQSQTLSSVASAGNFPPNWTPPHNEVGTVDTVAGLHYLPGLRLTLEQPPPGKCTVVVKAEQVRVATYPKCGCVVKDVKANGTVKQLILDEPRGFRRVFIEL